MLKDLRHAARMLTHVKGWTAVVVLSLGLGIGANAALFSAVNGMLLTKIPARDPDSLVRLRWMGRNDMVTSSSDYGSIDRARYGGTTVNVRTTFSYPMYQQFAADNKTMIDLAAFAPYGRVNAMVDNQAELATAFVSTGNYYQLLGVNARLGRTIGPDDDKATAAPVAMISSKYWHSRFGTDPAVVGKTIKISGVLVTIIGVLPPDFTGVQKPIDDAPEISMPVALQPQLEPPAPVPPGGAAQPSRLAQPTYWWLQVMGRLKPGATVEQVQGNLGTVLQTTARAGLAQFLGTLTDQERLASSNQNRTEVPRLLAESGARGIYDANTRDLRSVTILMVVVGLVLLIVCANVANLLLSRATARQKELSVRLSLGATRGRLMRQLLTESMLLAALGGALGILVGYWGRQLLPGPPGQTLPMDWRVLAFVAAITLVTGVVFGIAPALRGTSMNVSSSLKETSRSVVGGRSLLGKALLVVQVAISLVLLIGAGLFLQTLSNLRRVDVGFNPHNLLLFRVNPSLNRYDEKKTAALYRDLLERIASVPGVRGVALSNPGLLSGSVNGTGIFVQGRVYSSDRSVNLDNGINRLVISPNFFEVMGIPIVLGRGFTERDDAAAPKVVVINEAAARKYFPNENPIGRKFGTGPGATAENEIVGVLHDAKYDSVRDATPPTMYVPYIQRRAGSAVFEVRTAGVPSSVMGAIREAARQIDSTLPLTDVSTQLEQLEGRLAQERLFAQAYALFGALALFLASIGLFGLMSYNVSRRTNEIGIRMALGAQRTDVLRLIMRESMILVAIGVIAGLGIAVASSGLVSSLLFGLPPRDMRSMLLAVTVMVMVSALAGYLPARRASRVDPMVALHYE
jgi:predicted permease